MAGPTNPTKGENPSAAGKRVLIVDDSEITIELIKAELEGKGFEILAAQRAEDATALCLKKASRPNLILLDINMPNIDGVQFCRFLKGNAMFSDIKVLLCSGMEESKLEALASECGADGYVCKDMFLAKQIKNNLTEVGEDTIEDL